MNKEIVKIINGRIYYFGKYGHLFKDITEILYNYKKP